MSNLSRQADKLSKQLGNILIELQTLKDEIETHDSSLLDARRYVENSEDEKAMRSLHESGFTEDDIAKIFRVSQSYVSRHMGRRVDE